MHSDLIKVMTKFRAIDRSKSLHVRQKKKEQIDLAVDLFVILSNEDRSSDDL
jgi:septum formation topological specificity factor MinE